MSIPQGIKRVICLLLAVCFFGQNTLICYGQALIPTLTPQALNFNPPTLKYLSVNSANPYNYFNFLLDKGYKPALANSGAGLEQEAKKLIHYFFIGLTLPESSLWVNLRPDEPGRITSLELAQTDMGKLLLEQDLRLKKDVAQYLNPKHPTGKMFWEELYTQAELLLGKGKLKKTAITTSNRVWIVPDEAVVMETEDGALVTQAKLKVLLESEYLSLKSKSWNKEVEVQIQNKDQLKNLTEQLMKSIVIPEITKEVNSGKSYAPLRQIYHSLILAQWFKQKYRTRKKDGKDIPYIEAIDKSWLKGLESEFPWSKDDIWREYLASFQKGEYQLKEKLAGLNRMYTSGGILLSFVGQGPGSASLPKVISYDRGASSPLIQESIPFQDNTVLVTTEAQKEKRSGDSWIPKGIRTAMAVIAAAGVLGFSQPADAGGSGQSSTTQNGIYASPDVSSARIAAPKMPENWIYHHLLGDAEEIRGAIAKIRHGIIDEGISLEEKKKVINKLDEALSENSGTDRSIIIPEILDTFPLADLDEELSADILNLLNKHFPWPYHHARILDKYKDKFISILRNENIGLQVKEAILRLMMKKGELILLIEIKDVLEGLLRQGSDVAAALLDLLTTYNTLLREGSAVQSSSTLPKDDIELKKKTMELIVFMANIFLNSEKRSGAINLSINKALKARFVHGSNNANDDYVFGEELVKELERAVGKDNLALAINFILAHETGHNFLFAAGIPADEVSTSGTLHEFIADLTASSYLEEIGRQDLIPFLHRFYRYEEMYGEVAKGAGAIKYSDESHKGARAVLHEIKLGLAEKGIDLRWERLLRISLRLLQEMREKNEKFYEDNIAFMRFGEELMKRYIMETLGEKQSHIMPQRAPKKKPLPSPDRMKGVPLPALFLLLGIRDGISGFLNREKDVDPNADLEEGNKGSASSPVENSNVGLEKGENKGPSSASPAEEHDKADASRPATNKLKKGLLATAMLAMLGYTIGDPIAHSVREGIYLFLTQGFHLGSEYKGYIPPRWLMYDAKVIANGLWIKYITGGYQTHLSESYTGLSRYKTNFDIVSKEIPLPNLLRIYLKLDDANVLPVSQYRPQSMSDTPEVIYRSIAPWSKVGPFSSYDTAVDPIEQGFTRQYAWPTSLLKRLLTMQNGDIIYLRNKYHDGFQGVFDTRASLKSFLLSFGKDERGPYMSIYDVWDFKGGGGGVYKDNNQKPLFLKAELAGMNLIGEPIYIYDRYYLSESEIMQELMRRDKEVLRFERRARKIWKQFTREQKELFGNIPLMSGRDSGQRMTQEQWDGYIHTRDSISEIVEGSILNYKKFPTYEAEIGFVGRMLPNIYEALRRISEGETGINEDVIIKEALPSAVSPLAEQDEAASSPLKESASSPITRDVIIKLAESKNPQDSKKLYETVIKLLGIKEGNALEVGPGYNKFPAEGLVEAGLKVIMVDMLDGGEGMQVKADATNLSFPDESVEVAVYNQSFPFIASIDTVSQEVSGRTIAKALGEAYRVLKSGGWILIKPGHPKYEYRHIEGPMLEGFLRQAGFENIVIFTTKGTIFGPGELSETDKNKKMELYGWSREITERMFAPIDIPVFMYAQKPFSEAQSDKKVDNKSSSAVEEQGKSASSSVANIDAGVEEKLEKARQYFDKLNNDFGAKEARFSGVRDLGSSKVKARATVLSNSEIWFNLKWIGIMPLEEIERTMAHEIQHVETYYREDKDDKDPEYIKLAGLIRDPEFQDLQRRIVEQHDKVVAERGKEEFGKQRDDYQWYSEVLSLLRGYQIFLRQKEEGGDITTQSYEFIEAFREKDLKFLNTEVQRQLTADYIPERVEPKGMASLDTGGIDLSQIEVTLKDEKFISQLNPADLKVLRAAKYLKEGWGSLSLLYVHEIMLLLKDNLASDVKQIGLLQEVLKQLQVRGFIVPEIKLALAG